MVLRVVTDNCYVRPRTGSHLGRLWDLAYVQKVDCFAGRINSGTYRHDSRLLLWWLLPLLPGPHSNDPLPV